MMSYLPQSTSLGKLELIEVYEFYDQPILFSCRNASDTIFMAVFADENEEFETWLYASMSHHRFELIRSGEIDLHDVFSETEDGIAFQVQISSDDSTPPSVSHVLSSAIDADMLPIPGEFITLDTPSLPDSKEVSTPGIFSICQFNS
jgi:hypothetical protein